MKVSVKAKPEAREEGVVRVDETNFVVSVKEPPVQGRANAAINRALADYFKVPIFQVKLVSDFSSRNKAFEIEK